MLLQLTITYMLVGHIGTLVERGSIHPQTRWSHCLGHFVLPLPHTAQVRDRMNRSSGRVHSTASKGSPIRQVLLPGLLWKRSNTMDSKKKYPADSMPRQYVAKKNPFLSQNAYEQTRTCIPRNSLRHELPLGCCSHGDPKTHAETNQEYYKKSV